MLNFVHHVQYVVNSRDEMVTYLETSFGMKPTDIADLANQDGVPTLRMPFGEEAANAVVSQVGKVTLATATNVFAHVQQLGDFMRGLDVILKDHHQPIIIGSILPSYKSGYALINNEMYQFDGLTTPGFSKKEKLVENAFVYLKNQIGNEFSGQK